MFRSVLIGYKTASDVVSRLCSFAVVLLAVRLLPPHEFGLFSLAWAAGWMVSIGSDFGLQLQLAKEIARRPALAPTIFHHLRRWRLLLSAAVLAVVTLSASVLVSPVHLVAVLLVVLSQVFSSLLEFHNHLYRGLCRSDIESTLNLVSRGSTLALAGAFLGVFRSLPALALALALGAGLAVLATHLVSSRLLTSVSVAVAGPHAGPADLDPAPASGHFAAEILPIGLGILLSALYFRIDLFFIESWHGPEAVALFNSVFRLIDAVRLLPAAVMAVIFPDLCRPGATRTLLPAVFGVSILGLLFAAGGYWQASWLVQLCYGPTYLAAVPALRTLLLSLPFLFVNLVLTHQLVALNLQRAWAILCGMGLFCSLLLNRALVPTYGSGGAAWACLIRELLLTATCALVLFSRRDVLFAEKGPEREAFPQ